MIKNIIRRLTLFACTLCLILSVSIGLAACVNGKDSQGIYYLSLQSESWQTYNSEKDIPEKYLFKQSGDKDIYELEIALGKDEQFTVNDLGNGQKIGYANIFSADENLVEGENQSIKVAHQGTFKLAYDEKNKTLTYGYTATLVSVSISAPTTSLYVGDSYTFVGTALYSDETTVSNVTWSTSDPSVVTVSDGGLVSAISEGTAIIKASMGDLSDEVTVNVQNPEVKVTGVRLDKTKVDLELGGTIVLTATVLPENATSKGVLYASKNDDVATVEQDGTVKAVGYGSTIITVTTNNGGFSAECEVSVVRHVDAIRLDTEEITVVANGSSKDVVIIYSPFNVTNTQIECQITEGEDNVELQYSDGILTVKGRKAGKATVSVASVDNKEATATLTVNVLEEGAVLASVLGSQRLMIDESIYLTATIENESIKTVQWDSTDSAVATVVAQGDASTVKVTGVDFGSTVITATITDSNGAKHTVSYNILVSDEYFFIYGYGLGESDWDYVDYVGDPTAAAMADLLFEEKEAGIFTLTRYLTPQNGFQIIFPQVANYVDYLERWTKNIPSEVVDASTYFDSQRSDSVYISNAADQFKVNTAGIYTITLDLTGRSAKVYFTLEKPDVAGLSLDFESGSLILRAVGDEAVFSVLSQPSGFVFGEELYRIWIDSALESASDYLDVDFDYATKTVTVTLIRDIEEAFKANLRVLLDEEEAAFELGCYPESESVIPVTAIAFEHQHYYFNVNNGEGKWSTSVKATVNADATIQQVKYLLLNTSSDSFTTVDPDSGEIIRGRLGTSEIQAVAVGDETVLATCKVTFYSDILYLTGEFNDNESYDAFESNVTSLEGNQQYENYIFTMDSQTHFTLKVYLEAARSTNGRSQYGFQIGHLGMDSSFTSLIYSCQDMELSKDYNNNFTSSGGGRPSWTIQKSGTYILEVDLSGAKPSVIFNMADTPLQKIFLKADCTSAKKGETLQVVLTLNPYPATIDTVTWTLSDAASDYITYQYNETAKLLSVTVNNVEHAEDKEITVTCMIDDKSASIVLTVIAEHHLERVWDELNHWDRCTDVGCEFTENEMPHCLENSLTHTDPRGHYTACAECGYESGLCEHTMTLNSGWFDFSNDSCSVCGFKFFEIQSGVLIRYDGKAQWVRIPESVTEIGANVFSGHTEITSISLPNKLTTIGAGAFKGCSGLTLITIPDNVNKIQASAFSGVSARILWGKSPSISTLQGFDGYLGKNFTIPASVKTVSSFEGASLIEIEIPETVSKVNIGAFRNCTELKRVTISGAPKSLSYGGEFAGCLSLEFVLIKHPFTAQYGFGPNTFLGCTSLKVVYYAADYTSTTHLTKDFVNYTGNKALEGHLYAYAENSPMNNNWIGKEVSQYFAGTWHYDDSGIEDIDHVSIWGAEPASASISDKVTLFYVSKRKGD